MTDQERIQKIEEENAFMKVLLSRQSGEIQALQAAFHGLLVFVGENRKVRTQIELELEKRAASNLAESLNQERMDAFDGASHLIHLALASIADNTSSQEDTEK